MKLLDRRNLIATALVAVAGVFGYQVGQNDDGFRNLSDRPLIGIASLTSDGYVQAIRNSGGIPIVLPNSKGNAKHVPAYLEMLDGLILPGGADIPPEEYGEEPHETVKLIDDDRYQFEKALSQAWIKKTEKPLLGICLGAQWVNVASGGSLVQDIPSEVGISHRNRNHDIIIEPDSKLAKIFGTNRLEVNSLHHQAVDELGKNLRIVARCPDGVIEATESTDPDRFLIGVQWHPEKMAPTNKQQTKLLQAFVDAAKQQKTNAE